MSFDSFDGRTFSDAQDGERLRTQLFRVRMLMLDGAWRTLAEIETKLDCPQASISARLRDLRKEKFGALTVDRQRRTRGTFEYRVTRPPPRSNR